MSLSQLQPRSESQTMDDRSDEELIAATPGDVDAFATFYRRHAPALLGYLARRLGEPELAADVCAEAFAAALTSVRRYRAEEAPAIAWLYGIARHKMVDAQRRGVADDHARRRLGIPRLTLTDEAIERVEDLAGLDPSRVASALEDLPEEQREAVRARVLAGRSYADIARRRNTSEANVRQRVARGLARLRTHLGDAP